MNPPNAPSSPKKASTWWAILAVLLLVGAAAWYETQYRALSRPTPVQPVHRAPHKGPDGQPAKPGPNQPKPDESGLLIG